MRITDVKYLPISLSIPLERALSVKRGKDGEGEAKFVAWLVQHCGKIAELQMIDGAGNVHFKIGESETLFVAHTDTVHWHEGVNKYVIKGRGGVPMSVAVSDKQKDCLGADNGTGVSLMCHLMSNAVPGYYIFTRGEEGGGIGSKFLKDNHESLLGKFKRAITFDRRSTGSIITMQGGTRTASAEFAEALSWQLADLGLLYSEDKGGTYTDTKEYIYDIPECTNLSAGYFNEHGSGEVLDLMHLAQLAKAAVAVQWETLPTVRKVGKKPVYGGYGLGKYGNWRDHWDEEDNVTLPNRTNLTPNAPLTGVATNDGSITPLLANPSPVRELTPSEKWVVQRRKEFDKAIEDCIAQDYEPLRELISEVVGNDAMESELALGYLIVEELTIQELNQAKGMVRISGLEFLSKLCLDEDGYEEALIKFEQENQT